MWSLYALILGFFLDLLIGDPHGIPHPVVYIGKLIDVTEKGMRKMFPKTVRGENFAGAAVWLIVVTVSAGIPLLVLHLAYGANCWLGLLLETILCAQILATKSLKTESMKVYQALQTGDLSKARYAVSMIVGRDTQYLDEAGVTRAAVETVAENTSDGIIAPMLFLAIGGAPLGFFYKAVNTMDSMLGYVEMPYKNVGLVPAKMDDVFNYIPARISEDLQARIRDAAVRVFKAVGCQGLSRVDFFATEDGKLVFNEINTIPGFTSISMYPKLFTASGISYSRLIDRLLELALEAGK